MTSIKPVSPAGLRVRDARTDDLAAIQAIYSRHVLDGVATFEETPPDVAEMAERRAKVLAAGLPWFVAEITGAVAGYAYANLFHPRSAWRFTIEDSIYVAEDQRGRGVGAALIQALVAHCESGPWRQMMAVIGDSGNAASIALHRKCGFTPVGVARAVGFKNGRWVDVVYMQRALGPGNATAPS